MIKKFLYRLYEVVYKGFNKIIIVPGMKSSFAICGEDVRIAYGCDIKPLKNIYIGNHCQIGPHSLFWSTHAKIKIGNYVLMGPGVSIVSGDHRTDFIGKHIIEVGEDEKLAEHDADVIIKDGVWIASNVTILKGVTIGEGAVIAAGAIVNKDVEPYSIYGGVPAKKIKNRFSEGELNEHLEKLSKGIKI